MWISRQTIKSALDPAVQCGKVTLNNSGEISAASTGAERSVKVYAPYGYSFSLPAGSDLLLSRSGGEQVSFGTQMKDESVSQGEIKITSAAGGYIYLKNDGSVIINGLKINKEGVINDTVQQ